MPGPGPGRWRKRRVAPPTPIRCRISKNRAHWVKFEPLSDEFDGNGLDLTKWVAPARTSSNGHRPGLFSEKNVAVAEGKLQLTMRKEQVPPQYEKQGYHDYTCAVARSTAKVLYGYFEVRAKVTNSAGL